MKFTSDIDIDVADRNLILAHIKHHPAGIIRDDKLSKHASGIHITQIPTDPFSGISSIDYRDAEERGYIKLDLLNVSVYQAIRDEDHLLQLMEMEPQWDKLYDQDHCSQLTHIGAHFNTLTKFPEPVNSIPRLMMFLAVIRPSKRHLIGLPWKEVSKTIWDQPVDGSYWFKKSHSCAYAHLVCVHSNLILTQQQNHS
jgi:hypothetical protein